VVGRWRRGPADSKAKRLTSSPRVLGVGGALHHCRRAGSCCPRATTTHAEEPRDPLIAPPLSIGGDFVDDGGALRSSPAMTSVKSVKALAGQRHSRRLHEVTFLTFVCSGLSDANNYLRLDK